MTPFFQPDAVVLLQAAASSWVGTPFMPHAAIKGAGACCQRLAGAIYIECGFFAPGTEIPTGPMDWGHANTRSLVSEWVDAESRFVQIARKTLHAIEARPGDLLGFKIGGCVQHCGIVTATDGQFVHCFRGKGTVLSYLMDPSFAQRLERIWRPVM